MSEMLSCCQDFEVTVHTSPGPTCGTFSHLWLQLIGSQGESPQFCVTEGNQQLLPGSMCERRVSASDALESLLLIRLKLKPRVGFPDLDWHCSRVEVRKLADCSTVSQEDQETQVFLCDRWLRSADGDVELRSAKLCLLKDETHEKLKQQRIQQLQNQQNAIRWRLFLDGAPHCIDVNSLSELGPNLSSPRRSSTVNLQYLKGITGESGIWTSFTELDTLFAHNGNNNIAKFVRAHWKKDWYFGHQCLNGCNPLLLRRIHAIPPQLSVTDEMLCPFLPEGSSLDKELQKGTMFLLDYELLDGVPANVINGKQTYLSAPLCLLHFNQEGQLQPIAIQLQQRPDPQNPVFLPSDPGCDWLLAKIWVRSAEFHCHQFSSHYTRTHMLGELCCVATLRQLPEPHPLHQLLMAHVRTTLQINFLGRAMLLAPGGVFDKVGGCGLEALPLLFSRISARTSYRSLCVPDDLADRGVDKLPQNYYAQDALRIWDTLLRFVASWLDVYYYDDDDVQQDSELQHWITEINTHGFTSDSGFPQSFQNKAEVSKFVTMIIYCCSALHAAVNFSQLDFALWMPNCPASMMRPPPCVKSAVTEGDIISYLPDVESTCRILTSLTLLAQPASNYVPLCHYKEAIFAEGNHRKLVEKVQAELQAISDDITARNSQLELPYPYLHPASIENSVAI